MTPFGHLDYVHCSSSHSLDPTSTREIASTACAGVLFLGRTTPKLRQQLSRHYWSSVGVDTRTQPLHPHPDREYTEGKSREAGRPSEPVDVFT